jgi:hypothetical protein
MFHIYLNKNMKKCNLCGLIHSQPNWYDSNGWSYNSKEDAINGAIKKGKDMEKQLMSMKASYFEKKLDNYKVTYDDVPYYTSSKMITNEEIEKFEEDIKHVLDLYDDNNIKNMINAYEENVSLYKNFLSNIKSSSKAYNSMTIEKKIPPLPMSFKKYNSLYPTNSDDFMKDFTSSYSMKKNDYIKQLAKMASFHVALSIQPSTSLSVLEGKLYKHAELYGYIRQLANDGKLGFWDLFKLQQIHDFPLIDDIKETPEPSDEMIYQVTI